MAKTRQYRATLYSTTRQRTVTLDFFADNMTAAQDHITHYAAHVEMHPDLGALSVRSVNFMGWADGTWPSR